MSWLRLLCLAGPALWAPLCAIASEEANMRTAQQAPVAGERVRTEIPYRDGTVVLLSDFQERTTRTRYRAVGNVEITYLDMVIKTDEAEFDEATRTGSARGKTLFSQKEQWLSCSRADFDFSRQTGTFYDAKGFTDREFLVSGRTISKTGPDTYTVLDGFMTACQESKPKWSFTASTAKIRVEKTARLHNPVFRVMGVPVLYAPYIILPTEGKRRSSGFTPFHTGSSTSKGRVFSQGYFQTLGPSADVTLYGDYFTLRGLAWGAVLRARPNEATRLYLQTYGINDKLDQGGTQLVVDGETRLRHNFRAVARVNIISNFKFRQAFADSFRSATIPQEQALVFLTRNQGSFSTNFSFQREEVFFPGRSVVIRKSPALEFSSLGTPIGNSPLMFYMHAGLDGLSRSDGFLQTPALVQRLDFFPRVGVRIPAFAGFSILPTAGLRETYYSARLTDETVPRVINQSLRRQYVHFEIDVHTPTLERDFRSSWFGSFRHTIEPLITYRRITGIDHARETIRFDDVDAIADTNELEYGLVNRIFKWRETPDGSRQVYEFLSLSLAQKYYFDPSFGGAFRPGEPNMFYPLNTVTGFAVTAIQRNMSPASMGLRISTRPGIAHDVRADYDIKLQRLRDASVSTLWQQGKVYVAGTYFRSAGREPGTFRTNHIQGQAGYGTTQRGFSASLTLSYNIETSQLLNSNSRLNYMWDCCGVSLEFQQYALGLRTESRFSFSFTLKGIGSFGSIKRPDSLF